MGGLGVSAADAPAFEAAKPDPTPVRSAAAAHGLNRPTRPGQRAGDPEPDVGGHAGGDGRKITGGDTYAGVLSALAARPAAPGIPDGSGDILVLAGDVNHGPGDRQATARPGRHRGEPPAAGRAVHRRHRPALLPAISTPEAAEARAEKLHSADSAWIIVMDAPVGGTDPLWVNEMCDAIGATAVWAIVDATRKTADTARHLRTLGEVEALVVHGVELTGDPASVLGLDLPIFSLDGKPATPHAWAAMLCARIATDVMPAAAAPRRVTRAVRAMIRRRSCCSRCVISAPALYRYVLDQIDLTEMLIRFLIAVPIAAILLAGLRFVTAGYGQTEEEPGTPVTPYAGRSARGAAASPLSPEFAQVAAGVGRQVNTVDNRTVAR